MQYFQHDIAGIDGSIAQLYGYVLDNFPEITMERTRPAVLILPGGGYEMSTDREAEPIALKFVGEGFHAFVLRYSVAPSTYPTALVQAAEAMKLMRTYAEEWHIDPQKIIVLGFSAGGHLAANLATTAGDEHIAAHDLDPDAIRPNGLMLAYPVISSGEYAHRGSFNAALAERHDNQELLDALSLEKHVDSKTPPTFIWHTMTDDTVPVENSLMFIQSCKNAGVSVEAHLFPTGGHGLSLGTIETAWQGNPETTEPSVQVWVQLAMTWIRRTFNC